MKEVDGQAGKGSEKDKKERIRRGNIKRVKGGEPTISFPKF